jgi:hypothetical protein
MAEQTTFVQSPTHAAGRLDSNMHCGLESSLVKAAFELEVACSSKHARRQCPLANEIKLANDFEVL